MAISYHKESKWQTINNSISRKRIPYYLLSRGRGYCRDSEGTD